MSSDTASASSRFDLSFLTFGPFSFFTYCGSKTAGHGLMPSRKPLIGSRAPGLHTPPPPLPPRLVGAAGVAAPAAELELIERGERHEVLDERRAAVGALAEPH